MCFAAVTCSHVNRGDMKPGTLCNIKEPDCAVAVPAAAAAAVTCKKHSHTHKTQTK